MFAKFLMAVGLLVAVGGLVGQLFSPGSTVPFLYAVISAVGFALFVLGRHWNSD